MLLIRFGMIFRFLGAEMKYENVAHKNWQNLRFQSNLIFSLMWWNSQIFPLVQLIKRENNVWAEKATWHFGLQIRKEEIIN